MDQRFRTIRDHVSRVSAPYWPRHIGFFGKATRLLKGAVLTNILSRHTSHSFAAIFGRSGGPVDVERLIYIIYRTSETPIGASIRGVKVLLALKRADFRRSSAEKH